MILSFSKLILMLLVAVPQGTAKTFDITPSNTTISFNAKHFGVLNVGGNFTSFKGSIVIEGNSVKSAFVEIDTNTISTGNKNRDKSLKTDVFLNSPEFPFIRFESQKNTSSSHIEGTLKIKNTSSPVLVAYTTELEDQHLVLSGKYTLKRSDFNLEFGAMDDLVSNEVKVKIELKLPL